MTLSPRKSRSYIMTLVISAFLYFFAMIIEAWPETRFTWQIVDDVPKSKGGGMKESDNMVDPSMITMAPPEYQYSFEIVPMQRPKQSVIVEIPGEAIEIQIVDQSISFGLPDTDLIKEIAKSAHCRSIRVHGYWYEFDENFELRSAHAINLPVVPLPRGALRSPKKVREKYFKNHYATCVNEL